MTGRIDKENNPPQEHKQEREERKTASEILKSHVKDIYLFTHGTLNKREEFQKAVLEAMEEYAAHPSPKDTVEREAIDGKHLQYFTDEFQARLDRILRDKGASNIDVYNGVNDVINQLSKEFTIRKHESGQ